MFRKQRWATVSNSKPRHSQIECARSCIYTRQLRQRVSCSFSLSVRSSLTGRCFSRCIVPPHTLNNVLPFQSCSVENAVLAREHRPYVSGLWGSAVLLDDYISWMFLLQIFPLLCYRYFTFSDTVTVSVNRFCLFPLMVISATVTENANHTDFPHWVSYICTLSEQAT